MNPKNIIVLLGEEDLLKEFAFIKIKNKILQPDKKEHISFNYISLDGELITSFRIIEECQQLPFISNMRLVAVKNAEKAIDDNLLEYIKKPSASTCLILFIRKIDKRLGIYKTLYKYADIQEFSHPSPSEIAEWIQQYLRNKKKNISSKDANYIADILDNNMGGILGELEKLITYTDKRADITIQDIENLITENKLKDVFTFTEAIQNKNTPIAMKLVNDLLDQGEAVPNIMGSIRWMLTRLWQGKELIEKGEKENLSSELHIPYFFLNRFIEQAEKFKIEELRQGLIYLLFLEKLTRTYTIPHRLVLELLVVQLTEKTSELVNA